MDLTQLLNKELGLENLSQEEKEKIITRFGESLLKRIMFRIFQILSEQDRKNLEALQGGDEEKINQFLTEKIPDLEKIGCTNVHYLPFGYDPSLFYPESPAPVQRVEKYASDIILCNSLFVISVFPLNLMSTAFPLRWGHLSSISLP